MLDDQIGGEMRSEDAWRTPTSATDAYEAVSC